MKEGKDRVWGGERELNGERGIKSRSVLLLPSHLLAISY